MNWTALLIAFACGACIAAASVRILRRRKPNWSAVRRIALGVIAMPGLLALLVAGGVVWAKLALPKGGEAGSDATTFVLLLIGTVFGIAALLGGLVGATLAHLSD